MNYKIIILVFIIFIAFLLLIKGIKKPSLPSPSGQIMPNFLSLGGVQDATCTLPNCVNQYYNGFRCADCPSGQVPDLSTGNPPIACKQLCSETQSFNGTGCVDCPVNQFMDPNDNTKCKPACPSDQIFINNTCKSCTDSANNQVLYLKPNTTQTQCERVCKTVDKSFFNGSTCVDATQQPSSIGSVPTIVYKNDNVPEQACDNFQNYQTYIDKTVKNIDGTPLTIIDKATTSRDICKTCTTPNVTWGGTGTMNDYTNCKDCSIFLNNKNAAMSSATGTAFTSEPCVRCGTFKRRNPTTGVGCVDLCTNPLQYGTWGTLNDPSTLTCADCQNVDDNNGVVANAGNYRVPLSTLLLRRSARSGSAPIENDPTKCGWIAYYNDEIWTGNKTDSSYDSRISRCNSNNTIASGSGARQKPNKLRNACLDVCDEEGVAIQTYSYYYNPNVQPGTSPTGCQNCEQPPLAGSNAQDNPGDYGPGWIKGVDPNTNLPTGKCMFACDINRNNIYDIANKRCVCCPSNQFPVKTPGGLVNDITYQGMGYYNCTGCASNQYQYVNVSTTSSGDRINNINCITVNLPYMLNRQNNPNGATLVNVISTDTYTNVYTISQAYTNLVNPSIVNANGVGGVLPVNMSTLMVDPVKPLPISNTESICAIEWGQPRIARMLLKNLATGTTRIVALNTNGAPEDNRIYNLWDKSDTGALLTTYENSSLVAIFVAASTTSPFNVNAIVTIYRKNSIPFTGFSEIFSNFEVRVQTLPSPIPTTNRVTVYGIIGSLQRTIVDQNALPVTMTLQDFLDWGKTTSISSSSIPLPYGQQSPVQMILSRGQIGYLNGFWLVQQTVSNINYFVGLQGGTSMKIINAIPIPPLNTRIRCEYIADYNRLVGIADVFKTDSGTTLAGTLSSTTTGILNATGANFMGNNALTASAFEINTGFAATTPTSSTPVEYRLNGALRSTVPYSSTITLLAMCINAGLLPNGSTTGVSNLAISRIIVSVVKTPIFKIILNFIV